MLKYLLIFMLTFCLFMIGCVTDEVSYNPPVIEGYEVIEFRQPEPGELIWSGGNLVVTNINYIGRSWIVGKK